MGYEMVRIPAGTFTIGCTPEQGNDCYRIENRVIKPPLQRFYIGREVTRIVSVMGKIP